MPNVLINVSNRLPVTVQDGQVAKSSGGLVAALEGLSKEDYTPKWIGWPGASFGDAQRQAEVEKMLVEQENCIPVFLSADEVAGFYEGFANSSVWPLLHHLPNYLRYEAAWWDQYQKVNRAFAAKVLEHASENDLVWVHDYQLLLLPSYLKEAMPKLKVGFFLHTPFPPYDIFRCHPRRSELLAGMLGADRIGFHALSYLQHFASTVQRLLGIEPELTRIPVEDGRSVHLGVYPIGVNAPKFEQMLGSEEFKGAQEAFLAAHKGKRIIVSVERLDYTKGILHRLVAIDDFLGSAEDSEDLRFIFVSVPSRERIEEYKALLEEVESQVGRLNGKYATLHNHPIHFIHGSIPFPDLCAVYASAEIALVTPLVDGMNLVAKEYIACQRENGGTLILSEFAGAAEELFAALLVNPYDTAGVAGTLKQALALPAEEKRLRAEAMRERVMEYDARHWAQSFVSDLGRDVVANGEGTTEGIELAEKRIQQAMDQKRTIAFFIDYDGTLREFETEPAAASPSPEILSLLERLNKIRGVEVTIVSGRSQDDLDQWLGHTPLRLAAEHGAALREEGTREWERLDQSVNYEWKQELRPLLERYVEATPGSFIEGKHSGLVWHYRRTNREFGEWKARLLAAELANLTANRAIKVRHGKRMVELNSSEVNKGTAVALVLRSLADNPLAVCAGDDHTDENMFELSGFDLVSIKVGAGLTQAHFRVQDPAAYRAFLESFVRSGLRSGSGHSGA